MIRICRASILTLFTLYALIRICRTALLSETRFGFEKVPEVRMTASITILGCTVSCAREVSLQPVPSMSMSDYRCAQKRILLFEPPQPSKSTKVVIKL